MSSFSTTSTRGHRCTRHQAVLDKPFAKAGEMARSQGLDNGFRTIINTGRDGGQEVLHLHMHVIGGPRPWKQG